MSEASETATEDSEKWRTAIEGARLDVERARLSLENQRQSNENHRLYLEQWRTDLDPLQQSAINSSSAAVGFAQAAIRGMFILNGGALVALPAYKAVVQEAARGTAGDLTDAALAFVIGLALAGAASLLAYLAQSAKQLRDLP